MHVSTLQSGFQEDGDSESINYGGITEWNGWKYRYSSTPPLVGGFSPFEKCARQIGSSPQFSGWKIPKIFELPPPK